MTDSEIYEKLSDKIDKLIDKLDRKLDGVDARLQNHETRLVVLEVHDKADDQGWQAKLLMLLARCLVVGSVAVAALAGAGGILSKMFAESA